MSSDTDQDDPEEQPTQPNATRSGLSPLLLERIEPSLGRGEQIRLDASLRKLSLGRAEQSGIRLYTASASRAHAVISGDEAGAWVLTVEAGKSVLIDGETTTEPVVLEAGMNIILGQDHLRCVIAEPGMREVASQTAADVFEEPVESNPHVIRQRGGRSGVVRWPIVVIFVMGVGSIVFALLREWLLAG